ncbi:transcriptional regulator, putative [Heliomicrobium modesticaldum Ice1]|uniref:Stage 0 sporulation protein A homolog n=1 Tax=Heliobacterium modesticaldum (strain ATCC 51547 / Ice1) TaxID=498761 RepID=B0TE19_HELMI|nr:response regulator transcription factor [Heliomicrobium modesticaldum]ABZ84214.1 transcriptional regulator, putative [Heliomicrobium modesticaldum Ice1]
MRKILIVEDEIDVAKLVADQLKSEGFQVLMAHDGKSAIDSIDVEEFNLFILDIMLPDMDGSEVLQYIRRKTSKPVIMLTAKDNDMDKVVNFTLGADDYIVKPFSLIELTARVKAVLRRTEGTHHITENQVGKETILHCGSLEINCDTTEVKVKGNVISLKAKEFTLLKYLAERPNRVVTIAQIYESVWGKEFIHDDNTVMVHISRLRNKIEEDPANPQRLQTVRGLGYRLVCGK